MLLHVIINCIYLRHSIQKGVQWLKHKFTFEIPEKIVYWLQKSILSDQRSPFARRPFIWYLIVRSFGTVISNELPTTYRTIDNQHSFQKRLTNRWRERERERESETRGSIVLPTEREEGCQDCQMRRRRMIRWWWRFQCRTFKSTQAI